MTKEKIYAGTVGLTLNLDTGIDLTDATKVAIRVLTPDGRRKEWLGSVSALANTVIVYTTQVGDIAKPGTYKIQAYIEMSTFRGMGAVTKLIINKEFA